MSSLLSCQIVAVEKIFSAYYDEIRISSVNTMLANLILLNTYVLIRFFFYFLGVRAYIGIWVLVK